MRVGRELPRALLFLRVTVFLVMFAWTVDKFVRPEHAAQVWGIFYSIPGLEAVTFKVIGVAQLLLVLAFVVGFKKRFSYGAVLLLHTVSTLSSFQQYLAPYEGMNLLFFAAWPMLAACWMLYSLRDHDTILTV